MSPHRDNTMDSSALLSLFGFFGLDQEESSVYLSSLELGSQPASILAKKAGLKRGHVYNILSRLKDRGIMHEITRDGVRYFDSRSPSTLLSLLANKEEEIAAQKQQLLQALPTLEKLRNPLIVPTEGALLSGHRGIEGGIQRYDPRQGSATVRRL